LGGRAYRLYTRSTPKSDSEAIVSERHSSLDKEKDSRRDREMPERVIYDFNPIYKVAEFAMYAGVQ
jgi:hypothetical protein